LSGKYAPPNMGPASSDPKVLGTPPRLGTTYEIGEFRAWRAGRADLVVAPAKRVAPIPGILVVARPLWILPRET